MTTSTSDTLRVPGGAIFYRVRGSGPLLLILASGHADADGAEALCDGLVGDFTVVTYDRRGLSRSPIDGAAGFPTIVSHGDDVHHLLSALGQGPSLVFGSSIGALIGLDAVSRWPEQARVLVAHEPTAWELLPDDERDRATQALADTEIAFRRDGPRAAFEKLAALAAVDIADREPDASLPAPTPQSQANLNFLLANDTGAVNRYHLDLAGVRAASTRIVPAAGRTSRGSAANRSAERLAEQLGTPVADFPGGHTGWLLRPREFARRLREVLRDASR